MPAKRYIVSLIEEERQSLEKLTTTGKAAARKINQVGVELSLAGQSSHSEPEERLSPHTATGW